MILGSLGTALPERWLSNLATALLATVAGFVLLELGIRTLRLIPDDVPIRYVAVEGDEGYAPLPDQSRTSMFGVLYRTNALGLRGADPDPESPGRRIALLGDSVVWGHGVDEDQTIGAWMAALAAGPDRSLLVWNLGVPGNALFNEAARYERLVTTARPEVTVLISTFNDLAPEERRYRVSSAGTLAASGVRAPYPDSWRPLLDSIASFRAAFGLYWDWRLRNESQASFLERLPLLLEQVSRIHATALEAGSRLIVAAVPSRGQTRAEYSAFASALAAHGAANHIAFVDLAAAVGSPPRDDLYVPLDSSHPNGEGARMIAETLLPVVLTELLEGSARR